MDQTIVLSSDDETAGSNRLSGGEHDVSPTQSPPYSLDDSVVIVDFPSSREPALFSQSLTVHTYPRHTSSTHLSKSPAGGYCIVEEEPMAGTVAVASGTLDVRTFYSRGHPGDISRSPEPSGWSNSDLDDDCLPSFLPEVTQQALPTSCFSYQARSSSPGLPSRGQRSSPKQDTEGERRSSTPHSRTSEELCRGGGGTGSKKRGWSKAAKGSLTKPLVEVMQACASRKVLHRIDVLEAKQHQKVNRANHMIVAFDDAIHRLFDGVLVQKLDPLGVQHELKEMPVERVVGWMRERLHYFPDQECPSTVRSRVEVAEEPYILKVLTAKEFVPMVLSHKQGLQEGTLQFLHQMMMSVFPGKRLFLLVLGMKTFFAKKSRKGRERFEGYVLSEERARRKNRRLHEQTAPLVDDIDQGDIDMACLDFQLKTHCDVMFSDTVEGAASYCASLTRSVSEAPYRGLSDPGVDPFLCDSGCSLPIGKDGSGLMGVWEQVIRNLRGVTAEVASAIVAAHPSPTALLRSYDRAQLEGKDPAHVLQDLEYRRGCGVLSSSRRVGPETSQRTFRYWTSNDPDEIVG